MRRWEEIFPEADRKLLESIRWTSARQEFGTKPALLVIDMTKAFLGSSPMPVQEAVAEYPTSCGQAGWVALANVKKLLKACRAKHIPVIFTIEDAPARRFCSGAVKGAAPKESIDPDANEIPEPIAPLPSELVISMTRVRWFFRTPLASCLQSIGIDSFLVTGCTT